MKKICSRCLKIKDISKFSYRKDTKDNLYHYCRDCGNLMTANYRKKNRKKYLLSIKKRYKEYYYQYHKNFPGHNQLLLPSLSHCLK